MKADLKLCFLFFIYMCLHLHLTVLYGKWVPCRHLHTFIWDLLSPHCVSLLSQNAKSHYEKAKSLDLERCAWLGGRWSECWLLMKLHSLWMQLPWEELLALSQVQAADPRTKTQLPFSSWMLEQCHSCPLLGMFCVPYAFNRLGPVFPSSLSPLLTLSLSCVILTLEKGESLSFKEMFYPLQEFTISSRLKSSVKSEERQQIFLSLSPLSLLFFFAFTQLCCFPG